MVLVIQEWPGWIVSCLFLGERQEGRVNRAVFHRADVAVRAGRPGQPALVGQQGRAGERATVGGLGLGYVGLCDYQPPAGRRAPGHLLLPKRALPL